MKVEELRTEGRVYRRCFSRLGTAVEGRANAGGTAAAVRKMRCRSGFARPSRSGGARGQGLACVEGHRGRVCFPCGGGLQGRDARRWVRFYVVVVFLPRGVFSAGRFTRLGCVVPGVSRSGWDGICAPVQAKFQKLSRKPSKGSLCGAVSACERRLQSGGRGELFIVGGDL